MIGAMRRAAAFVLLLAAVACGGGASPSPDATQPDQLGSDSTVVLDAGVDGAADTADLSGAGDAEPTDSADLTSTDTADSVAVLLPVADSFDPDFSAAADATVTTLVQTLRPKYGFRLYVDNKGVPQVPQTEFGKLYPQPGEAHITRNELSLTRQNETRRSVLYFLQFGDGQVSDNESPATVPKNTVSFANISATAYDESFPFIPHLTDAVIQTAMRFSQARAFDFAIQLGDLGSNGQKNELMWAVALMGGGSVNPDTGADDDPLVGTVNDARDPFWANGFGQVKWYAALGNHDALVNGNFPAGLVAEANTPTYAQAQALAATIGLALPGVTTSDQHPNFLPPELDPALLLDPNAFTLDLLLTQEERNALQAATIVADPQRVVLNRCEIAKLLHEAPGQPAGHGLSQANVTHCANWYAVDPVPGLPVRLLVLDTSSPVGGAEGVVSPPLKADGSVDESLRGNPDVDQLAWLKQQLEQAKTDGVAVLIASHHVSSALTTKSLIADVPEDLLNLLPEFKALVQKWLPTPQEALSGAEFRALLTSYPNVIAHLGGHWHANAIRAICPDGTIISATDAANGELCVTDADSKHPGRGYYEIIGPAPQSFPHQGRIVEIVDNGDGTGSLYTTVIDAQGGADSLFLRGRLLSLARLQAIDGGDGGLNRRRDRNTELLFLWPEAVRTKLDGLALPTTIESQTTLTQPAPPLPRLPLPLK